MPTVNLCPYNAQGPGRRGPRRRSGPARSGRPRAIPSAGPTISRHRPAGAAPPRAGDHRPPFPSVAPIRGAGGPPAPSPGPAPPTAARSPPPPPAPPPPAGSQNTPRDRAGGGMRPPHGLELSDRLAQPLPPSEALAGVLRDQLDQRGRRMRDPIGPGLPHRIEQDAIIRAGIGRGRGVELSGV